MNIFLFTTLLYSRQNDPSYIEIRTIENVKLDMDKIIHINQHHTPHSENSSSENTTQFFHKFTYNPIISTQSLNPQNSIL